MTLEEGWRQSPSNKSVAERFEVLRQSTYCPFAESANITYGSSWDNRLTIEENVLLQLDHFSEFCLEGDEWQLDMFVLEVTGRELVGNLNNISRTLNSILISLNSYDSDPNSGLLTEGIEDLDWDFQFLGTEFIVPVFAPFYPEKHPRYSGCQESAFITFQPDHSFTRHNITSKNPNRYKISQSIRDRFTEGGSPYDIDLIVGTPKAIRYIKPLSIGDEPIEWWKIEA